MTIDYTDCTTTATADFGPIPDNKVYSFFKSSNSTAKPQWKTEKRNNVTVPYSVPLRDVNVCTLQFSLPNDIGPPVYLYYTLTNFYQNHRRYVKSLYTDQLKGKFVSNSTIGSSSCDPLKLAPNGKAYYPCGLIANSIFNDTINSPVNVNSAGGQSSQQYTMTNKSIAWSSDAQLYTKTVYQNDQVMPPPNWILRYPDGYTDQNPIPDLSTYEEFQVWMRTAALPNFSKLALRNDADVMRAGIYNMEIYDCKWLNLELLHLLMILVFPVSIYGGTKSIMISTRTIMGGKNSFLGIAYVVIGGICIVLGVLFTLANLIKPRWVF